MRVLSFDPGFERLGVAVLQKEKGKEQLLYSECFRTSASLAFPRRLQALGAHTEHLIKKWKPGTIALEQIFFEKNAKTAMQIAEVRGVLTYLAATHGIPVMQYSPAAVKIATTGYGKSSKSAVGVMVLKLLGQKNLHEGKRSLDDEVDAIAVGITCLASLR